MTRFATIIFLTLTIFGACQRIETGDSLDKKTISHLREMKLLDENEKIIKYYSNYNKSKAGNFFTDKRIAHYWLDKDDSKTEISFAYYQDIISIDTTFNVHDFDIPYMTVKKRDGNTFNIFIDGTYAQKKDFFEEAINLWNSKRKSKL